MMEQSSPLAAMQPPSVHFGNCFHSDATSSFSQFPAVRKFGPDSFNFRDLSMKKGQPDYLSMKPLHGSSPTASLAADLSQNFHIDQSPQLVTPRRSLFSANLFCMENAGGTTPPLPSSSPAPVDLMDMSPLPHKIPFSINTDMELESPTTGMSMSKGKNLYIPSPLQESPVVGSKSAAHKERRRPPMLRPSLIRTKAHSSGSASNSSSKGSPMSNGPKFKFAAGGSKLSTSTSMSLAEMFDDSPPRDSSSARMEPGTNSMAPPRQRPFPGSQSRANGSPGYGPVRKSSNPFSRPRKQCRRSLSMFENPEDMMKDSDDATLNTSTALQSITDIDSTPTLNLPYFIPDDQPDSLPRIQNSVLVDILDGKYNDRYDDIIIIDCRFEYEYEGGHIDGAINYNDKEFLAGNLFNKEIKPNTALVFHCEYSAHRAPIMAKFIRHKDRAVNIDEYPKLTYPEMYILHGGYSAFFAEHRSLCIPQNYVEMAAKEHEYACERGLGRVKQRSKLSRAQTFAFGQSPQMEDSPTGRCRTSNDRNIIMDSPLDRAFESGRIPGRRMFSY